MDFMVIWGFEFFERFVARGGTIVQHLLKTEIIYIL